ncbi:MAG: hypothetical protein AMXMBFR74_09430 [Parvibaculum sp.]|uniref:hypothetical protein n=1 Tax=Parvibaculum sp. TaxID=2024848 RepID=UPI0035B94206
MPVLEQITITDRETAAAAAPQEPCLAGGRETELAYCNSSRSHVRKMGRRTLQRGPELAFGLRKSEPERDIGKRSQYLRRTMLQIAPCAPALDCHDGLA